MHLFGTKRDPSLCKRAFSVGLLVRICLYRVSFLSWIITLTVSGVGICTLLRVILGLTLCPSANVVCIDLFWFIATRNFSYHSDPRLRRICKFHEATKVSS